MMNVMVKTAGKGLANKTDRTPEEDEYVRHDGKWWKTSIFTEFEGSY